MPPMPGRPSKGPMPKFPVLMNRAELAKAPISGVKRAIVLLIDFSDNPYIHPSMKFQNLLFSTNNNSLTNYYLEVSYDSFTVNGEASGWYRTPHNYSYYVAGGYGIENQYPNNVQKLVEDAVKLADETVNFKDYDNDGDGYVDAIFVVHSGPGAEETGDSNDIWSHKWQLSDLSRGCPGPYLTNDGVYVDVYSMEPERMENNSLVSVGVFCHEFCHVLGAPDLYNTSSGSYVVGRFCLMDKGSWNGSPPGSSPAHISAWLRYLFGWVEPTPVERGNATWIPNARIPAVENESKIYRLLSNPGGNDWSSQSPDTGEYFLIENRQQIGFDASLPGSGLLIWHIDESQTDNNDANRRLACVMQADTNSSTTTIGEASDMWKSSGGGFSNSSIPSSALWDGTATGVSVTYISASAHIMTATLRVGPVLFGRVYNFPNPCKNGRTIICYIPTDEEELVNKYPHFKVTIFNLAGEKVRVLDKEPDEIDRFVRQALWNCKNDNGGEVASGLYFYIIETEGERNRGKITFIH